jgi:hypothetical protein
MKIGSVSTLMAIDAAGLIVRALEKKGLSVN